MSKHDDNLLIMVNRIYTIAIRGERTRVWVDEVTTDIDEVSSVIFHPIDSSIKWTATREQFLDAIDEAR